MAFRGQTGGLDLLSIDASEPPVIKFRVKEKASPTVAVAVLRLCADRVQRMLHPRCAGGGWPRRDHGAASQAARPPGCKSKWPVSAEIRRIRLQALEAPKP
jgi:hypothetical protein